MAESLRNMSARQLAMADSVDGCLTSTRKAVLRVDALDTVSRIYILDNSELPAGSTTLTRCDGRRSQEVLFFSLTNL
jgi:hypothetical protein